MVEKSSVPSYKDIPKFLVVSSRTGDLSFVAEDYPRVKQKLNSIFLRLVLQ